jgi:hypothetical protein
MKNTNLKSTQWLNYWRRGDSTTSKNLFLICLCIWFVLLFCRLLRKELGEFVFAMERNPSYSMKTLDELCESRFCKGIGKKTSRERRDEDGRRIFEAG